jgi:hypothetical protein
MNPLVKLHEKRKVARRLVKVSLPKRQVLDMGLKSGPDGVKAQFREKFFKSFGKVDRLTDLVKGLNQSREGIINVIDGNVLLMAAPQSVQSYYEYVTYTRHALRQHAEAATLLLVVFDEPKHLTTAKLEEQIRRDEVGEKRAMVCSDDLAAPVNDEYDLDELVKVINCRELILHRPARLRFFDSIIMAVLEEGKRQGRVGRGSPLEISEIIVDGIDGRGANRPVRTFASNPAKLDAPLKRNLNALRHDLRDAQNTIECKSRNPKSTRRGSSRVLTRFGSNCLLCRAGRRGPRGGSGGHRCRVGRMVLTRNGTSHWRRRFEAHMGFDPFGRAHRRRPTRGHNLPAHHNRYGLVAGGDN